MTQTMDRPAPVETATPQYIMTDADRERTRKIAAAWRAYHGDLDKPLKPMPQQADDNVMSNRIKPVVNTGVFFLFGKELEISVAEGAPEEAQKCLDKVWGRKEVRIPLLQRWGMNGGCAGQGFLRIVPVGDGTFRLIGVDPSTVYTQEAPQDCDTVTLYCIQYAVTEPVNGQPKQVWYREEISANYPEPDPFTPVSPLPVSWTLRYWTFTSQHGIMPKLQDWKSAGPDIEWSYAFAPIFDNQNMPQPNEHWGLPDVTPDLIGLNDALNFNQSNTQRINKMYGNPWPWATGIGDSDVHTEPGRITLLPIDGKMGAVQFTSDIPSALQFAANLRSDIDEQSNVPSVATGRIESLPRGQMSGIAIELLYMPILMKTETKRCTYGKTIIDVSKAILVLSGFADDIDIILSWTSPVPKDDLQSWQAVPMMQTAGISKTTIQRERGYDPEEEMELSQTEDAQALQAYARGQGFPPPGMAQPPVPGAPPPMPGQPAPNPFIGGGH